MVFKVSSLALVAEVLVADTPEVTATVVEAASFNGIDAKSMGLHQAEANSFAATRMRSESHGASGLCTTASFAASDRVGAEIEYSLVSSEYPSCLPQLSWPR